MERAQSTIAERKPPEPQLWGPYFKSLRERHFTRPKFIRQYLRVLDDTGADEVHYGVSEAWLARIERGATLNTSRETIELLCTAVACSDEERVVVLALADRNFVFDVRAIPAQAVNLPAIYWLIKRFGDVILKLALDPTSQTMVGTMLLSFSDVELSDADVLTIMLELLGAQDAR